MTFIEFFNALAVLSNPALAKKSLVTDESQLLADTDIDSLDQVMVSVYLCDVYRIPEEVGKRMPLTNLAVIQEFLAANAEPLNVSFEDALKGLQ